MSKYDEPVVITGMGAVSPCGLGVDALWSALVQGQRPQVTIEPGEAGEQPVRALKVSNWQPADWLGKRGLQYLRPSTQFLSVASLLAMRESDLADGATQPDDLGIVVGCNLAGLQSMANYDYIAIKEGPQYVSPMEAPNTLANAPASHLAIRLKARALNTTFASGQCTGLDTLGYVAKILREGRAKQIVAGGVEELNPAVYWVYRNSQVLPGEDQENVGHPFNEQSRGWLPSEGAAVLVMERKTDALARGASPLAELAGWSSGFAPSSDLEKRSNVLKRVAQQALDAACLSPEQVDVVVAGASGLQVQDQAEAMALHDLLATNMRVSVTAIKGTLGETYSPSGLFQALAAVCMFNRGLVPRTVGVERWSSKTQPVKGLLTESRQWPDSKRGTALLLAQDLYGSTSAVVLRGC